MRRRPWALVVLAVLHMIAPIGNIIMNAVITDRNVLRYLIHAMSPQYLQQNWVIVVAPLAAGISIYMCKRWSFFAYLVSITGLFIFSYAGYSVKAETIGVLPIVLVFIINIAVVSYFLIPAVRTIYFDRRMRWWEIQPRYKCDYKCSWREQGSSDKFQGQVGNISINGLFLKSDELPKDHSSIEVTIHSSSNELNVFKGEAILHKKVDALGFGIKFDHTPETKKMSKHIVSELDKKGMKIATLTARPEDSFAYWFRKLLTTGQGLLPKKEK